MGLVTSPCLDLFGAEWLFLLGKTGLPGVPVLLNIGKSDWVAVSWMFFQRLIVHSSKKTKQKTQLTNQPKRKKRNQIGNAKIGMHRYVVKSTVTNKLMTQ